MEANNFYDNAPILEDKTSRFFTPVKPEVKVSKVAARLQSNLMMAGSSSQQAL